MKTNYFILIIFIFLGLSIQAQAQNDTLKFKGGGGDNSDFIPTTPDIFPPSPTAAEFAKYGEIPVSYYTGTPNIEIPIYSISSGQLSLPINLSYHSSGIKVEDIAPWTGYGWSLNAGGVVTRSVVGKPDDVSTFNAIDYIDCSDETYNYFQSVFLSDTDSEYDKFYFNFLNYSGSFIIVNGEAVITPVYQKIKIIPHEDSYGTLISFTIITADGTKFIFADPELTQIFTKTLGSTATIRSEQYNSSWYLTQIISSDKTDVINFSYEEGCFGLQSINKSRSIRYLYDQEKIAAEGNLYCGCSLGEYAPIVVGETSKTYISNKFLTEITTNNNDIKISFLTEIRNDYNSGNEGTYTDCKKLDKILIYGANNELIKGYDFDYNNTYDRLFLTKIKNLSKIENGEYIESVEPPYSFEYLYPDMLDNRESLSQDHWGYFNSAENSDDDLRLIPFHPDYEHLVGSADRASTEACLSGMLTQINYPTGGYSKFEFGTHKIPYEEYNEDYYKFSNAEQNNNLEPFTNGFDIYGDYYNGQTCNTVSSCFFEDLPTDNLNYSCDWIKSINFTTDNDFQNFELAVRISSGKENQKHTEKYGRIMIYETAIGGGNGTKNKGVELKYQIKNTNYYDGVLSADDIGLQANKRYYIIGEVCLASDLSVDISYDKVYSNNNNENNIVIGGARIEKIITNNGINDIENILKFDYSINDNSEKSSGKLFNFPNYEYTSKSAIYYTTQSGMEALFGICYWSNLQHMSLVPLGASSGSHVGYSRVKISNGEEAENGYTINNYKNDTPDSYYLSHPFAPVFKDNERGKLTNSEIYDNTNKKIKQIENKYKKDNSHYQHIKNCKTYTAISGVSNPSKYVILCSDYGNAFWRQSYLHDIEWLYLEKTTETIYDKNNNEFTTITEYYYDNPDHSQLSRIIKKEKLQDMENELFTIENYYPLDGGGTLDGDVLSYMNTNHIINPVIKKTKTINNNLIAGIVYDYDFSENENFIYINKNKVYNNTTNTYEQLMNIKKNNYGNIIEYNKENDIKTAIIWGHNHSLPVAKIENASYDSYIENLSNNIQDITNSENLFTALECLYSQYNSSFVTIYTYNDLGTAISTVTDANQKTTEYKYNEINKLKLIKDFEGNILKYIEYHYKN